MTKPFSCSERIPNDVYKEVSRAFGDCDHVTPLELVELNHKLIGWYMNPKFELIPMDDINLKNSKVLRDLHFAIERKKKMYHMW